jgi:predicted dehydrogenase
MLFGTKGFIEVVNINNPEKIRVFDSEYQLVKEIVQPQQITGFEYQVEACIDAIEAGAMECPQMPHDEILRIMGIMDDVRARWGLKYPNE